MKHVIYAYPAKYAESGFDFALVTQTTWDCCYKDDEDKFIVQEVELEIPKMVAATMGLVMADNMMEKEIRRHAEAKAQIKEYEAKFLQLTCDSE